MSNLYPQSPDRTVVCYVRAPLLLDPIDSKIETLRTCEANGSIDSLLLRSWPDEVALTEERPNQEVVARFERFEQWAETHDVSIRPPFDIRTVTSLASDESRQVLVTPILCFALYSDDRLVGVYPHTEGDTTCTAAEAIAALRTGETPPLPDTARPIVEADSPTGHARGTEAEQSTAATRTPTTPTTCPDCGGELGNVHGIAACTECRWNDTYLDRIHSPQAKLIYLSLLDDPVSVESLKSTLGLPLLSVYGIVRTLSERGLVERTDDGTYRACRLESRADERTATSLRPD